MRVWARRYHPLASFLRGAGAGFGATFMAFVRIVQGLKAINIQIMYKPTPFQDLSGTRGAPEWGTVTMETYTRPSYRGPKPSTRIKP